MSAFVIQLAFRLPLAFCVAIGQATAPEEQPAPASRAPDVYVNDSPEADDLFAKARRLADQGEWSRAALTIDECLASHADKVISVAPGYFRSLPDALNEFVATWPPEGIRVYNQQLASPAQRQFDEARQANDLDALNACAQRYFCTSTGLACAEAAAELALEGANFALARRLLERLASIHPERDDHLERLRAKIAVTDALTAASGGSAHSPAPAARLPDAATVSWKGEDRALGAVLREIQTSFAGQPAPDPATHWPTFFGAPDRAQVARFAVDRLAELWRLDAFGKHKPQALSLFERSFDSGSRRTGSDVGRLLAMHPVYAAGLVYIQDAHHVWAVRADTGRLQWSFGDEPAEAGAASTDGAVAPWYGATVADGRVFACLGSSLAPYYGYEQTERAASVAAIDAITGRIAWKYVGPAEDAQFAEFTFDPSPVVADGVVFVIERRRRAFGFEDCSLLRLDARTGEVLSRTHLAGASTGGFGYRRPTVAFPALTGDTVYVGTNLGVIAAVSAHTGAIRWLRVYNRDQTDEGRSGSGDFGWRYNPVVVSQGRIFALPTDVNRLLILDADSGRIEREIRTAVLGNAVSLYGVIGTRVYGVGVEAFAYDLAGDRVVWLSPLPEDEHLSGRGILTAESMLVPTWSALCRFDLADGDRRDHPFTELGEGGNVIVAGDRIILAGAAHLSAYADKEMVWRQLRSVMADRPTDPTPALDFAEISFRSGDVEESLDALADAIRRAGGFATPVDPEVRRRIFDDCMSFAASLEGGDTLDADRAAPIIRLYEFAAQCPPDRTSHVRYRVRLADVCARSGDPARAVDLYQQIIADRSLRDERIDELTSRDHQSMGAFSEQRIRALIESSGRGVYSRHDQDAEQLYAASHAAGDLEGLKQVTGLFPNSLAAPRAAVAAADLLLRRGQLADAVRAYRDALERHDPTQSQFDRVDLLMRLASAFKTAGRDDAALDYLTAAANSAPHRRASFNGREDALSEHLRRQREAVGDGWRRLPRLPIPLADHYERSFAESVTLLTPTAPASTNWRNYFVYSDASVHAFVARSDEPAWPEPASCRMQPQLITATPSRVVLATRHQILTLDASSGSKIWSEGIYPADLGGVHADHENFSMFRFFAVHGGRLLAIQDGGQAVCRHIEDGRTNWSGDLADRPLGQPVLDQAWAVYPAVRDDRAIACVLDARDGKLKWRLPIDESNQIIWLTLTADDRVLAASAAALYAFDAESGERLWRRGFNSPIAASGIRNGLDGLYVAAGGGFVEKLRLTDGGTIWRSDALTIRPDPVLRIDLVGDFVLVSADSLLVGLDAAGGHVRFEPAETPYSPEHVYLTDERFVVVQSPAYDVEEPARVLVYDLANGAQVAPAFLHELGRLGDVRRVTICDAALVIQDSHTIHGWSSGK